MFRFAPRFQSPLQQALWATALMVFFGLAIRFVWGAYDPEMRTWTFVMIAPLMGLFTYLQSRGRDRIVALGLIGLGLGGLLFWTVVLVSRWIPITGRADYAYISLVFAFPVASLALGWMQLRKLRRNASAQPKT